MRILVFNSGSTSQKTSLYDFSRDNTREPVWKNDAEVSERPGHRDEVIAAQLKEMRSLAGDEPISVVGHRIVHGGTRFRSSTKITAEVKQDIERLCELAPLHNPAGLEGIIASEKLLPGVPQIAVFDTSVHSQMPLWSKVYPLPYSWYTERGIQRYGFHGINHAYCFERAAEVLRESNVPRKLYVARKSNVSMVPATDLSNLRVVTCHLGGGCSIAAMQGGHTFDTTMGYTPLEGLMMATRSGSIDPGILIDLLRKKQFTVEELDKVLNRESGLEGVSGVSGDMREVLAAASNGNERAQLAIDIYVQRLANGIAAMAASMGGLNALVFSAGVGENSAVIRKQACDRLGFMGVHLDERRNENARNDTVVSSDMSPVTVLVIKANENLAIANECVRLTD